MSEPSDEPAEQAEHAELADESHHEAVLADPDDYHRSQRLRQIHKARDKVHQHFTSFDTYTGEATHNNQKGRLAYAITAYVIEILPILRQTDTSIALPPQLPWDTFSEYVTTTGHDYERDEYGSYQEAMMVFELANQRFAEIKPLVETDETDEWDI